MKDAAIDKIRNLLPELYPMQNGQPAPGKICTPESGCGPVATESSADILNVLPGSNPGPLLVQAEIRDRITDSDDRLNIVDLLCPKKPKR